METRDPASRRLKQKLFVLLEAGHSESVSALVCDWAMILLIVANVAAVVLETVEPLHSRYATAFLIFELFSVAVFTLEYSLRIWVCNEHPSLRHLPPVKARLKFAVQPFPLIDLLAILPFYLSLFLPAMDLRVLRIFRLLRLLKLARYSPALATLWRVLCDERRALAAALVIMLGLLVLSASAIYYAEREAQPEAFADIPSAMWWALATLTTVGYGDVVPVTGVGRAIGGMVMIFGLAMFALPIGIIASGFANEIHRRDFVVTWGMVARVPLFAKLDALSVSRITNLLRSRVVAPNTVIMRRGETADAMYFIAGGEVEIDLAPEPMVLREGDFFGEIALLRKTERMATARTLTRCRLLVLGVEEFNELIEADGDLKEAINAVAEQRLLDEHHT